MSRKLKKEELSSFDEEDTFTSKIELEDDDEEEDLTEKSQTKTYKIGKRKSNKPKLNFFEEEAEEDDEEDEEEFDDDYEDISIARKKAKKN